MKTSELITVPSCTELYKKYRGNWTRRGLHEYAKSIYSEKGENGIVEHIILENGGAERIFLRILSMGWTPSFQYEKSL